MKTLYLIRHAKSSWKDIDLKDYERPLNKRGLRDAPFMASLLQQDNILPELIISSPAIRAYNTAIIFAEIMGYDIKKIEQHKRLYEADIDDFVNVISPINDEIKTLFIFSHNPGITLFNNWLADKRIDNIPTTGIVRLELKIKKWENISFDCGKLITFDFPKKYST